jgi:hypothetical protein
MGGGCEFGLKTRSESLTLHPGPILVDHSLSNAPVWHLLQSKSEYGEST